MGAPSGLYAIEAPFSNLNTSGATDTQRPQAIQASRSTATIFAIKLLLPISNQFASFSLDLEPALYPLVRFEKSFIFIQSESVSHPGNIVAYYSLRTEKFHLFQISDRKQRRMRKICRKQVRKIPLRLDPHPLDLVMMVEVLQKEVLQFPVLSGKLRTETCHNPVDPSQVLN